MTSNIAEKLLEAIKAAEDAVPPLHIGARYVGPRTEAERGVLRRCTADREIIALHKPATVYVESWNKPKRQVCVSCSEHVGEGMYSDDYLYPCETLLVLARGYGIQP